MKLNTNVYTVNKQPSREDGSMRYETTDEDYYSTSDRKSNRWNRCLQLMKVILYLELILFIGWVGCVFITNYYEVHNHNGPDKSYSASEWSQDPDSLNSAMDSNSVLPDAIKWLPEQDDENTTTVSSQTDTEPVYEKKHFSEMETTTATNIIEPDDTDVESMLLSRWLEPLTMTINTWDDSSSKSTNSEGKFASATPLNKKSAFKANSDGALSPENRFGTIDKDDEIDLPYLLTLPIWYNVVFTSDYLDKIVESDKDSFQEDEIANARFIFSNPHVIEHHSSRKTRSTIGQEEDNSSSSPSEESTTTQGESDPLNSESSEEDQCPTILDDEGTVIKEPKDIDTNWVHWLDESDIPECEELRTARSVAVNKCGKVTINCVIDESGPPMRHHRDTRSVEKNNIAEKNCEHLVAELQQNFEAWRAKLVIGKSSDPMVQNLYQNVGKHVFALSIQEIVNRTSGGQPKTNKEWYSSVITMEKNISELIDSKHRNLLINSSELTLEMGADLGKIVETTVDIYINCRDVLLAPPQAQVLTMLVERERCLKGSEKITTIKNKLAAEIVPGESTNLDVITLRQRFKANLMLLIISMARNRSQDNASVPADSVNVTDEQWTSYMLDLKQEMAQLPEDPDLRKQLEDAVSPTQDQTNELREIVEYYLRRHVQCSMFTLFGLMGEFEIIDSPSTRSARSADSKWEPSYIETYKNYQNEENLRRKRTVAVDLLPTPTIVSCTLEDDDIEFAQERQERLERYNQLVAHSTMDVRGRFLNAIEQRLNGTSRAENSKEKSTSDYMRYVNAVDVFVGNSSSSLQKEGYRLLRDIILEIIYLDGNETAFEGYDMDILMKNWTGCLMQMPDNYTAEMVLMAIIKAGEAINLHYSGLEDGKNDDDEFTPVYGTFTYVGEQPEKSIVRRWRHIFRGIVRLYFRINNPKMLPKLHCTSNKEESQTEKPNVESASNLLGKRSFEYTIPKSDEQFSERR